MSLMYEGLTYKVMDYKEKSEIVYLYSNIGNDSILVRQAKDYKKGLLAFCAPFTYVRYTKTNSKLPSLIDYEIIDSFSSLKTSLKLIRYATIILEVTTQLEDKRSERIFNYLVKTLKELPGSPSEVTFIYLVKMLYILGVLPDLESNLDTYLEVVKEAYLTKDFRVKNYKEGYLIKLLHYYENTGLLYFKNIKKIMGEL